ncbi:hypothetical protein D9M71_710070 [compost metagenome]
MTIEHLQGIAAGAGIMRHAHPVPGTQIQPQVQAIVANHQASLADVVRLRITPQLFDPRMAGGRAGKHRPQRMQVRGHLYGRDIKVQTIGIQAHAGFGCSQYSHR